MVITVRPILRTDKPDSTGNCPIVICITANRKRIYHATGHKINANQWENGKVIKHNNATSINAKIGKQVSDIELYILRQEMHGGKANLEQIKAYLQGDPGAANFITYAQRLVDGIENTGTHRRYQTELDELKKWKGGKSFADITPVFLSQYYEHITKGLGKQHNTAINAFKFIRMVFNHALKMGVTSLYPFKDWEYPKYKATVKGYLTLDECERVWQVATDLNNAEEIRLTAVYFCLECFSGIRVSDWGKFSVERVIDRDDMILRTTKTGTEIRLPLDLMPSLRRTIDYIKANDLRWTYSGEHANRMLKLIAPLAKIEKRLTTHVARHSFATHMLSLGLSRETVAEMLGVTLRVVDTYAKFSPDKIRNEIKRLGNMI